MSEKEEFDQLMRTLSLTLAFHPKSLFFLKTTAGNIISQVQYIENRNKLNRLRSALGSIRMFKKLIAETNDPLLIRNAETYG